MRTLDEVVYMVERIPRGNLLRMVGGGDEAILHRSALAMRKLPRVIKSNGESTGRSFAERRGRPDSVGPLALLRRAGQDRAIAG